MKKEELRQSMQLLVDKFGLCVKTKDGSIAEGDELSDKLTNYFHDLRTKNLPKRREEFIKELSQYVERMGKDSANAFFRYWSETSIGGWKMRFEKEKTWDLEKRVATWMANDSKYRMERILRSKHDPDKKD